MILDKAKMAHEWAVKHGKSDTIGDRLNMVRYAWGYADAMQAEADKRAVKLPDVFFDTKQNKEWQPDWSQAPDGYDWWAMDRDGFSCWHKSKPSTQSGIYFWIRLPTATKAPSFNYQSDWQDSLRKRP